MTQQRRGRGDKGKGIAIHDTSAGGGNNPWPIPTTVQLDKLINTPNPEVSVTQGQMAQMAACLKEVLKAVKGTQGPPSLDASPTPIFAQSRS